MQQTQEMQVWFPSRGHPWRRAWQPNPGSLPGESHGQRRLVGYNPWGHKEMNTSEVTEQACRATGEVCKGSHQMWKETKCPAEFWYSQSSPRQKGKEVLSMRKKLFIPPCPTHENILSTNPDCSISNYGKHKLWWVALRFNNLPHYNTECSININSWE